MRKLGSWLLIIGWILFVFYLFLPEPAILPVLPNSMKAQETKDTVEIPGASICFSNLLRSEVVKFYTQSFSRSPFLNLPLLTYRLNHPPEKIVELLGEKQKATYVEEVIHPLKSSFFISGYEWENDPSLPKIQREKNNFVAEGQSFKAKVTLYYQKSSPLTSVFVFLGISFASWLIFSAFFKTYDSFRHHR